MRLFVWILLLEPQKFVVDELRTSGVKAGLLKVRMFRPFPTAEEIAEALWHLKAVAVMDKSVIL